MDAYLKGRNHIIWVKDAYKGHILYVHATPWTRVLFIDESQCAECFQGGRIRVLRRQGERYHDDNVMKWDRYGGGSVMVWGGIGMAYKTPLYRVQGNLNGVDYMDDILQPPVLLA